MPLGFCRELRILLLSTAITASGHAAVVYSNFSPASPGYSSEYTYGLSSQLLGPPPPAPGFVAKGNWAMGFTLAADSLIQGIEVPLLFETGANTVQFSIYEANVNGVPGTLVASTAIAGSSPSFQRYSANFASLISLEGGLDYFLVASIQESVGRVGWASAEPFFSGLGLGPVASSFFPQPWSVREDTQAAFTLFDEGGLTSVPEPGGALLLLTGIGGLAIRSRWVLRP